MPIPVKIKPKGLAGKHAVLDHEAVYKKCFAKIPAGTQVLIDETAGGYAIGAETDPCPACGITIRLGAVPLESLSLIGCSQAEDAARKRTAFWQPRGSQGDYLWAECSNCGFRAEARTAVKQGRSSCDYVKPVWHYCPRCGKRMAVMDPDGKMVL